MIVFSAHIIKVQVDDYFGIMKYTYSVDISMDNVMWNPWDETLYYFVNELKPAYTRIWNPIANNT